MQLRLGAIRFAELAGVLGQAGAVNGGVEVEPLEGGPAGRRRHLGPAAAVVPAAEGQLLVPAQALLASVAALPGAPYCVGFAAESENLLQHGVEKRVRKNVPLLIGNIGHQTFGKDQNSLVLFDEQGHTVMPHADKQELARHLVAQFATRLATWQRT